MGCRADVDTRFYPSMVCTRHAIILHGAVEAHKEFIQGWVKNIAAAEQKPVAQIPKRYCVYYMQFPDGIKIGTTHSLGTRLRTFCLPDSALLAVEPGGFDIERSRHEFFKESRIGRSEVFKDSPKIRNHIEAIKKYHGEPNVARWS
jgi:hypothetical protein